MNDYSPVFGCCASTALLAKQKSVKVTVLITPNLLRTECIGSASRYRSVGKDDGGRATRDLRDTRSSEYSD